MSAMQNIDKKIALSDEFNKHLFRMVKLIESKFASTYSGGLQIDQYKRRLSAAKSIDSLLLIETCRNKLWEMRDHILSSNEAFFINNDYNEFLPNDEKKEISHIIQLLKQKHKELSNDEKTVMWGCLQAMLRCSIEYTLCLP